MSNQKVLKLLLISTLFFIQGCSLSNAACGADCCKSKSKYIVADQELGVVNQINLDTIYPQGPLVCTLSGQEQIERKELLKSEIFSQLTGIEALDFGYVFKFEKSDIFLLKLMDYIIVESACCPFFKYDFSIEPYSNGIELKVSGTREVKELLKIFVEEIEYDGK